jgi:hypothetical protein
MYQFGLEVTFNSLHLFSACPKKGGVSVLEAMILLLAKFRQILTWKIWFQPIQRIFHAKEKTPNLSDFEGEKSKPPDFYDKFK